MSNNEFSVRKKISKVEWATITHEHTVQTELGSCVCGDVGELPTVGGREDVVSPSLLKLARRRVIRVVDKEEEDCLRQVALHGEEDGGAVPELVECFLEERLDGGGFITSSQDAMIECFTFHHGVRRVGAKAVDSEDHPKNQP